MEGGIHMKFGERVSELRKDKGLKQKDIATLLNVAVSTVSNYETDSHEPDMENLCKLADLFGVSTDYLLGRTDIKTDINALKEPISSSITKADGHDDITIILNLAKGISYFFPTDTAMVVRRTTVCFADV